MALWSGAASPENFATLFGFVWLAVVVTLGARSILGALLAGIGFTVLPAIFTTYLSPTWAQVPTVAFGLGAVMIANNPDGVVATQARQLRSLGTRLREARHKKPSGTELSLFPQTESGDSATSEEAAAHVTWYAK